VLSRLSDCHTRLQPCDCEKSSEGPLVFGDQWNERHPKLLVVGKCKPLRHHAHDDVRCTVDEYRSPDDLGASRIAVHPDVVSEQHDVSVAFTILFSGEIAAENGMHAECREEIPRNAGTEIALRLVASVRQ